MERKRRKKRRPRPRKGSDKREPAGQPGAKVHNLRPREWVDVCGAVTRMGGQLVEIPKGEA